MTDYEQQQPDEAEPQQEGELYVDRGPVEEEWVEPAGWPKVIGTISVVWGGLALTCTGCGVFGMFSPQLFASQMQTVYPDGMPPVYLNPPILAYASIAISVVLTLYLIASGIMLLLRRPVARGLHLVYGIVGVAAALFGLYVQYQYQAEVTDWVKQNPDTKFAQAQGSFGIGQTIGIVVAIVVGLGWPVFCLLWFGLVKRDSEEIARGAGVAA